LGSSWEVVGKCGNFSISLSFSHPKIKPCRIIFFNFFLFFSKKQINYFPRAFGCPAATSLSDEGVLFACGETMLKRFHKLREIVYLISPTKVIHN